MFWKRKRSTEPPAPEEHLQAAAAAIAQADWTRALVHLAWALDADPGSPEARELLDRVLRATRDPLSHAPILREAETTPYQIGGVRAYIHAWRGQLDEAVSLMAQIYCAVPGLPFLPWLTEWLSSEGACAIDPAVMAELAWSLPDKLTGEGTSGHRRAIEQLLPLLTTYWQTHPQATDVAAATSILLRDLDRVDEALVVAREAHQIRPTYYTAGALSGVYRAIGDLDATVEALRDALDHRPDDVAVRLDIGDILCGIGRSDEGLAAYQEVLDREPNHPWALPSYLYQRSLLEPEGPWQAWLEKVATENPDNTRARQLSERLNPYRLCLPEPSDATINMLSQIAAQGAEIRELNLSLSTLESPSARLAVTRYQAEHFGRAALIVSVAEIQEPDPRQPAGQVDYVLWRYDGLDPRPAVRRPSRRVARAVTALAGRPYHAETWSQRARSIAAQLGPRRINGLLGVMVHPPKRPAQHTIWAWIYRVQVAAAFVIAHLGDGWTGSVRQRALFSLARGPMDWTVGAAIIALAQLAREEPGTVEDIAALYLGLFTTLPKPGGVPYLHALVHCTLQLPALPAAIGPELRGVACYHRGIERTRQGDYDAAIVDYGEAIRLAPRAITLDAIHLERGLAYSQRGEAESALADYDEALRWNPENALVHYNRGVLLYGQGEGDAAIAGYDRAIHLDPELVPAYYNRGIARRSLGDLKGAIADYSEAIRLGPDFAAAYNNRAIARVDLGDLDGAVADYTGAIRIDAGFTSAYRNRGSAYSKKGDYDRAIADYSEAIRLDPRCAAAYNGRGNARNRRGDLEGATADYSQAIAIDPLDAKYRENRGIARGTLGDTADAMADFDEAIRLDPQLASAYMNRGVEYHKRGENERAIAEFTQAILLDPQAARAHSNRAAAHCELGDYDSAIADCDEAIRLDPDYATAYNNRGYAHLKKGGYDLAIADSDVAISLRPHGYFYNTRGQARGATGDYAGAVADLQEALRLIPDHPEGDDIRANIARWSRKQQQ